MTLYCSFNGLDGSGKTTQANRLAALYPDQVDCFGDLAAYPSFPKLLGRDLARWWFEDSSVEEFCTRLYLSIQQREEHAKKSERCIVILDKGLYNFEARMKATLVMKGSTEDEATRILLSYRKKLNIKDFEELKVLFTCETDMKKDSYASTYSENEIRRYETYRNLQKRFLKENSFSSVINVRVGIDETGIDLLTLIRFHLSHRKAFCQNPLD